MHGHDPGTGEGVPILTVVGLGPGDMALLTPQALAALQRAELLVGYRRYLELLPGELLAGRQVESSGMMAEMERCSVAIDAALAGRRTVLVSSGDAGVYGMAGLALELIERRGLLDRLELDIVPGVPAVIAAAALLGAPLTHDFACVSLSDLLTPWLVIEKRVVLAAEADFVLALYNPRSRRRDWQLPRVLELLRGVRSPDTPVGIVREAFRPEQRVTLTPLSAMDPGAVDMLSIVIVGNSQSRLAGRRMVTPRGYLQKYDVPSSGEGA